MYALRRVRREGEREREGRRDDGILVVLGVILIEYDGGLREFDDLPVRRLDGTEVHRP